MSIKITRYQNYSRYMYIYMFMYIYTVKYISAVRKGEIIQVTTMQIDLRGALLYVSINKRNNKWSEVTEPEICSTKMSLPHQGDRQGVNEV